MTNSDSPVFTATQYLAYLRSIGSVPDFSTPQSIILYYQSDILKYVTRKYSLKRIKIFGSDLYLLKKFDNKIGIFGGFGAGAPATTTVVDLFCALGVEQFFIIGMAGGLQPNLQTGSLVLSRAAICGEGVSRHYVPETETIESNTTLLDGFSQYLSTKNYVHSVGTTWTTDTPFREMKSQVNAYQDKGILTVEMEAAAMLAVAKANNRSGLASFSVSDSLANGIWSMPKDLTPARNGLFVLLDGLVSYLNK